MRTNPISTAICTAGLVSAEWIVTAQIASSAPAVHDATVQRFVLVDHTGPTEFTDVRPAGISLGDSFTFSEAITRDGKPFGSAGGTCTETAVLRRSTSSALPHRGWISNLAARTNMVTVEVGGYSPTRRARC